MDDEINDSGVCSVRQADSADQLYPVSPQNVSVFQYSIEFLFAGVADREDGVVVFHGTLRHFSDEPILIGGASGGGPLKLGFRVLSPSPTTDIVFEDRVSVGANQLEPTITYPFRLKIPCGIAAEAARLRIEFLEEGSYWFSERGGSYNRYVIERTDDALFVLDDTSIEEIVTEWPRVATSETSSDGPIVNVAPLNKPGRRSAKFELIVDRLNGGGRIRHSISRNDYLRYHRMRRFVSSESSESILSVTDHIQETGSIPSAFFTDSMIAIWLSREDLQSRFHHLDTEACQYAFLAWYLCVRPVEEGLEQSCEPTGPILRIMSQTIVSEAEGIVCSALMLAAYCYFCAPTFDGDSITTLPVCKTLAIVSWFFCEAAYFLRTSYAIPQRVRTELAATRSTEGSPIIHWMADRLPQVGRASMVKQSGIDGILTRLDSSNPERGQDWRLDLLRESLIIFGRARFDDPVQPVIPAVCQRLKVAVRATSALDMIEGHPEYMCIRGSGERLMVQGEWYAAEPTFTWSRAPLSTILFRVTGSSVSWLRLGLLFDRSPLQERGMRILLNHNPIWSGTIREASAGELILACTGRCIAFDAPNILQVEVEEAFVPAEHSLGPDDRRLGVGLKRLWVQCAEDIV